MRCGSCGYANSTDARFCAACGAYLDWQAGEGPDAVATPGSGTQPDADTPWWDVPEPGPAVDPVPAAGLEPATGRPAGTTHPAEPDPWPVAEPEPEPEPDSWLSPEPATPALPWAPVAGSAPEPLPGPDFERFAEDVEEPQFEDFEENPPVVEPAPAAAEPVEPVTLQGPERVRSQRPEWEPEPVPEALPSTPPAPPPARPPAGHGRRAARRPPSTLDEHRGEPAEPGGVEQGLAQQATTALQRAAAAIDASRRAATEEDRPDLDRHLEQARARLAGQLLGVAVVGEFKRGKSTLVNALLHRDICPVDADIVTAVPTMVRHGPRPAAFAVHDTGETPDGSPAQDPPQDMVTEIELARLNDYVCEAADPALRRRLRSVEVQLPHRLLSTGLAFVDTPGVGGLDSAHAAATLGALRGVAGVLFVTDASQELTRPEVEFLQLVLQRSQNVACVVTKTDLYPHWRTIVELNAKHLATAGLEIPIMPVSSFLRLRARHRPDLDAESGFAPLFTWLGHNVVQAGVGSAVRAAARDIDFAKSQLQTAVTAERIALSGPAEREEVTRKLEVEHQRTGRLTSGAAGWQQALSDGVQDLFAEVEYDLQERFRALLADTEGVIDAGDPVDSWADIGSWLERRVVELITENTDLLTQRADELASDVASTFMLESGQPLEFGLTPPLDSLRGLTLRPVEQTSGGNVTRMVVVGRTVSFVPMVAFGLLAHLGGLALLGPLSVVGGLWLGRKVLRDERTRQLTQRRQQAKFEARRYLDQVGFVVTKESRNSLRRTQRELRDEFNSRANVLHASNERALLQAQRSAMLDPAARRTRAADLAARERALERLGQDLAPTAERAS